MATSSATTPASSAAYIEHMVGELRLMSIKMDATFLSYLLEMAMIEASDIASGKVVILPESDDVNDMDPEELARRYFSNELD